jgi:hypothetical protein
MAITSDDTPSRKNESFFDHDLLTNPFAIEILDPLLLNKLHGSLVEDRTIDIGRRIEVIEMNYDPVGIEERFPNFLPCLNSQRCGGIMAHNKIHIG